MAPLDTESAPTKIIHAAGPLFADLGYEIVSVREIAAVAGVHFSAINYHFGSKDKLYIETLRTAATCGEVKEFVEQSRGNYAEPAAQLREIARRFLADYLPPRERTWEIRLLAREMLRPGPFSDVLQEIWAPSMEHLARLFSALRGWDPAGDEARFRAGMFFMLLDSIGQSQSMIEGCAGHPVELDWLVDQVADLFVPELATANRG